MIMKQCNECKDCVDTDEANINYDINYINQHFKEYFEENVDQGKIYFIVNRNVIVTVDDIDQIKYLDNDFYHHYVVEHDDIININNIDDDVVDEYFGKVLCRSCKIDNTLELFYNYIINKQIGYELCEINKDIYLRLESILRNRRKN